MDTTLIITWSLRGRLLTHNPANIALIIFLPALLFFAYMADIGIGFVIACACLASVLGFLIFLGNYCEAARVYKRTWNACRKHYQETSDAFDRKKWMRRYHEPCPRTGARLAMRDYESLRRALSNGTSS